MVTNEASFAAVETLVKKAAEAENGGEAMAYARAACAGAISAIHYVKEDMGGDDA
jgi:uncharacterized membrane protein